MSNKNLIYLSRFLHFFSNYSISQISFIGLPVICSAGSIIIFLHSSMYDEGAEGFSLTRSELAMNVFSEQVTNVTKSAYEPFIIFTSHHYHLNRSPLFEQYSLCAEIKIANENEIIFGCIAENWQPVLASCTSPQSRNTSIRLEYEIFSAATSRYEWNQKRHICL